MEGPSQQWSSLPCPMRQGQHPTAMWYSNDTHKERRAGHTPGISLLKHGCWPDPPLLVSIAPGNRVYLRWFRGRDFNEGTVLPEVRANHLTSGKGREEMAPIPSPLLPKLLPLLPIG